MPLGNFENSWVYDERTLHYLQAEMEKLLEVEGSNKMAGYAEALGNMQTRVGKEMPVYDA